jgi:serine/alanine adding enzyme
MRVELDLPPASWTAALEALPSSGRDVYFTPAYHRLHEINGDGRPSGASVEDGRHRLFVPGLRVAIPGGGGEDLQTCNGYGGPLATEDADPAFLDEAWARWREAAARSGLVAAFFRLHPLAGNARWLPRDARVVLDRPTVALDVTAGLPALWEAARPRHRRKVRSAQRDGWTVRWNDGEDWEAFPGLYADALDRLGAPERLRFSGAYFEALRRLPEVRLAAIRDVAGLAAAAVFLAGPLWYHYHLSARRPGTGNDLTSLLLQEGLEQADREGKQTMHVGGGRTAAPDDTLLAFKQSLGGRLLDFEVARVVVDAAAYDALVESWRTDTGRAPEWLLGYRQPRTAAAAAR